MHRTVDMYGVHDYSHQFMCKLHCSMIVRSRSPVAHKRTHSGNAQYSVDYADAQCRPTAHDGTPRTCNSVQCSLSNTHAVLYMWATVKNLDLQWRNG